MFVALTASPLVTHPGCRARHCTHLGCLIDFQALSGLNFQKFKEAVENYTFKMTKPPQNDDAFQQVRFLAAMPLHLRHHPGQLYLDVIVSSLKRAVTKERL